MIKYALLLLVLLSVKNPSFSQESQATKEETIAWLKDKLSKHYNDINECRAAAYCNYSLESVEINECEITY